jgi:hypothetical protein
LERVLNKETSAPFETTGEDRISKLTNKANRIIDMCVSDVNNNKKEVPIFTRKSG